MKMIGDILMSSFINVVRRRAIAHPSLATLLAIAVVALCTAPLSTPGQQPAVVRAVVRHGFTLDGRVEGSVLQLGGEDTTFNDGAALTGDLFVPGVPTVRQNDAPFGGVQQGSGGEQPAGYEITLNGNALLGHLVTRTDPAAMLTVATLPAATGTRDVALDVPGQSPGDFSTLRDLTLNSDAGAVAIPPGTYRTLTANGGSTFVLGVAGASQPATYNLDSFTLNNGSRLQVVGPIVLTVATTVSLNGITGAESHPLWLNLHVASGSVTLNGGGALYGSVTALSGTITINSDATMTGVVVCDRLAINAGGLLRIVQ